MPDRRAEARGIGQDYARRMANLGHARLAAMVGAGGQCLLVAGASGQRYVLNLRADWDGKAGGAVRVWALVDDGGWFHGVWPWTVCELAKAD